MKSVDNLLLWGFDVRFWQLCATLLTAFAAGVVAWVAVCLTVRQNFGHTPKVIIVGRRWGAETEKHPGRARWGWVSVTFQVWNRRRNTMAIRLARVSLKHYRVISFAAEEYERLMLEEPEHYWGVTDKGDLLVSIEQGIEAGAYKEYTAIGFIEKPIETELPKVSVRVALFDPRTEKMIVVASNSDAENRRLASVRDNFDKE